MSIALRRGASIFFVVVCLLSCGWAATALLSMVVQMQQRQVMDALRADRALPQAQVADALHAYQQALRWVPCASALQRDALLLLARQLDTALAADDQAGDAAALDDMHAALMAQTACSPMDGKAWLDLAELMTLREGFSASALQAYKMSAEVAPGESWLAQKRLLFALKFRPLLDAQAKQVALHDLAVLSLAHPNRLHAVLRQGNMASPDALAQLFHGGDGR